MGVPPLRCRICGRTRPDVSSGVCKCGSMAWELIEHPVPEGVLVETLAGAAPLVARRFSCPLSEALGGVVLGRTILVGGLQGAGKSTLCAELAAQMAHALDGLAYWLDAEMSRQLVAALFERTNSRTDRIRRIPMKPDGGGTRLIRWTEALRAVPPDAAVIVIDSIQRWAPRMVDQTALLNAITIAKPTVLAISHANK